jgi:hypothetical protein
MNCTTLPATSNATPARHGLLERLVAAIAAPAVRELPPATLRELSPTEAQRAEEEVRAAWHRFMPCDVPRGF